MAQLTMIFGAVGVFVTGFAGWYTLWHHKVESCFERVPVRAGRNVHLVREDIDLDEVLRSAHGDR